MFASFSKKRRSLSTSTSAPITRATTTFHIAAKVNCDKATSRTLAYKVKSRGIGNQRPECEKNTSHKHIHPGGLVQGLSSAEGTLRESERKKGTNTLHTNSHRPTLSSSPRTAPLCHTHSLSLPTLSSSSHTAPHHHTPLFIATHSPHYHTQLFIATHGSSSPYTAPHHHTHSPHHHTQLLIATHGSSSPHTAPHRHTGSSSPHTAPLRTQHSLLPQSYFLSHMSPHNFSEP
ncbi:hypothetical protein N665_0117s0044 [Sinapis alba]|nr:hypothetical protein N665_0117s0044 [Sinapis alba]